eukprot:4378621-Amphidinium_carterae.1
MLGESCARRLVKAKGRSAPKRAISSAIANEIAKSGLLNAAAKQARPAHWRRANSGHVLNDNIQSDCQNSFTDLSGLS